MITRFIASFLRLFLYTFVVVHVLQVLILIAVSVVSRIRLSSEKRRIFLLHMPTLG